MPSALLARWCLAYRNRFQYGCCVQRPWGVACESLWRACESEGGTQRASSGEGGTQRAPSGRPFTRCPLGAIHPVEREQRRRVAPSGARTAPRTIEARTRGPGPKRAPVRTTVANAQLATRIAACRLPGRMLGWPGKGRRSVAIGGAMHGHTRSQSAL